MTKMQGLGFLEHGVHRPKPRSNHYYCSNYYCVVCVGDIQLGGTWQVLVRSTFRQNSTLPSSVKFIPEEGGTVRLIRVRNIK